MATEKYHGRTESQRRADQKYKDSHFDRLAIMLPKGHKSIYKDAAQAAGLTWRQFVITSMDFYTKNNLPDFDLDKRKIENNKQKDQSV